MAGSWRGSRIALVAAALALLAGTPAGLAAADLKNPWVLGGSTAVAAVVVVLFGVVCASYRKPRSSPPVTNVADMLASALVRQWARERHLRQIGHSFYEINVRWVNADMFLDDERDRLVTMAKEGESRASPPRTKRLAAHLAESHRDLAGMLTRMPTRRLVVLGDPGAGKSQVMLQLALDLLRARDSGDPVPFLISISSWNPANLGLRDWLARRIEMDYPFLAIRIPHGRQGRSRAQDLLDAGLIMPFLDGLDEIPEMVQSLAIARINDALRPKEGLVVTCRTDSYAAAARSGLLIQSATAIQLLPLMPFDVARYLSAEGRDVRWEVVVPTRTLPAEAIMSALSTPLFVALAGIIYNPKFYPKTTPLPDPSELLLYHAADDIQSHLLDSYLPAVFPEEYVHHQRHAVRVERWLTYLAAYMERRQTTDLAWWELQRAVPVFVAHLAGGVISGFGAPTESDVKPRTVIRIGDLPRSIRGLPLWQQLSISAALGIGAGALGELTGGVIGLVGGAAAGLVAGIACGLPRLLGKPAEPIDEIGASIRQDRAVAAAAGIAGAVLGGVLGVAATRLMGGTALGLAGGSVLGFLTAVAGTAWGRFQAARAWLAWRGYLPWRLVRFLHDAQLKGVMRQNGSMYQFRHALLQARLARSLPKSLCGTYPHHGVSR